MGCFIETPDQSETKNHASGGQGMIPWTPGCECSHPSFLGVITFTDGLRP
ncbi:hypothetical protein DSLASN_44750 [Desulfoluna limicola]|uniref:Uncharacterized protein n=1 Tax=Desulfoluna limicola TaxID=2810562 RepID=A0ABN6F8U6_9BACT|nr:hypothetical protein DSLASN_44750 [Desulfoluna limicola]